MNKNGKRNKYKDNDNEQRQQGGLIKMHWQTQINTLMVKEKKLFEIQKCVNITKTERKKERYDKYD